MGLIKQPGVSETKQPETKSTAKLGGFDLTEQEVKEIDAADAKANGQIELEAWEVCADEYKMTGPEEDVLMLICTHTSPTDLEIIKAKIDAIARRVYKTRLPLTLLILCLFLPSCIAVDGAVGISVPTKHGTFTGTFNPAGLGLVKPTK